MASVSRLVFTVLLLASLQCALAAEQSTRGGSKRKTHNWTSPKGSFFQGGGGKTIVAENNVYFNSWINKPTTWSFYKDSGFRTLIGRFTLTVKVTVTIVVRNGKRFRSFTPGGGTWQPPTPFLPGTTYYCRVSDPTSGTQLLSSPFQGTSRSTGAPLTLGIEQTGASYSLRNDNSGFLKSANGSPGDDFQTPPPTVDGFSTSGFTVDGQSGLPISGATPDDANPDPSTTTDTSAGR